jgi:hypothetical protein
MGFPSEGIDLSGWPTAQSLEQTLRDDDGTAHDDWWERVDLRLLIELVVSRAQPVAQVVGPPASLEAR